MYCKNCGEEIVEGARFCQKCAEPIDQSDSTIQNQYDSAQRTQNNEIKQRASIRQQETAELQKMIRYFSQKSVQYAEYDRVSYFMNPAFRSGPTGLLVGGIICGVVGFFVISIFSGVDNKEYYRPLPDVLPFLLISGCVLMIVAYIITTNNRKKNYENNSARFEELSNELYQHYVDYGYCLVSAEYTNPENLKAILQTIESGRADTIKEAINILVEDAHRSNMQSYAAKTAAASAAAARGATVSAVFSAANFFRKR